MKVKIFDVNKTEKGSKELPVQFREQYRDDLIQRAVLAIQANRRQAYGTMPNAGNRHKSGVSRRRRDYKATYGIGISRVPRKIMSRNGTQMNRVGAIMPGAVGGRIAHPPKSEKIWKQKINSKENRKAICSAISATMNLDLVKKRNHAVPKEFPFIVDNKIETLSKTADVEKALEKLGFNEELERVSKRKVRAGSGKGRGRKYQNKIGPLFVVSGSCPLIKAARNIPGVEAVSVHNINAELLAPGCHAGRLALWTENAVDNLSKDKLFTDEYKGKTIVKEEKLVEKKEKGKIAVKKAVKESAKSKGAEIKRKIIIKNKGA